MTALFGGLEYNWLNMQKPEKIEEVTAAQDDGFVDGALNTTGSICRKPEKIEKVTAAQDDHFVGFLEKTFQRVFAGVGCNRKGPASRGCRPPPNYYFVTSVVAVDW